MAKKPEKSKRFRYNLATLLKVRVIRERQAQDAFNEAEKRLEEEKRREEEVKQLQAAAYADLHDRMASGDISDMNDIQIRKHHLEKLGEQVAEQIQKREDAEKHKEEMRDKLIQAVKEKKVLEKDKENKRKEWKKLMDKEAGKFLDDINSVKFAKIKPEND